MYCAMFLAIVLCYFQRASFYWLLEINIERQVARGMLHTAVSKKCVAALGHLLQKVESVSTTKCCITLWSHVPFLPAIQLAACCPNKTARQVV